MGRTPIGKKAMTDAERQQRSRAKAKKATLAVGHKAEREKRLAKAAERYIPMPPGVTYWETIELHPGANTIRIWQPTTRPLAAMAIAQLEDDDIVSLLAMLSKEAKRRGLQTVLQGSVVQPPRREGDVRVTKTQTLGMDLRDLKDMISGQS